LFDISDVTVKYWASGECYKEAVKCYENSMVNNVQIKRHFNPLYNANFTNINAEVKDNNSIIHNVFIIFNDKTGIVSISCDCTEIKKKRGNDNICTHVAAVLIKYARDKEEVIEASKDVFTKKFIGRLRNSILNDEISGKPLNIEVKYEFSSSNVKKSSIELKIGEDKLYILKDVEAFCMAVTKKQEIIEYGKQFTYDPRKYYIKEEDKALIDFIKEIYLSESEGIKSFEAFTGTIDGKRVYLSEINLKEFFRIMKNKNFEVVIDKIKYSNVKIKDMFPELKMYLNEKLEAIEVGINGELPIFLNNSHSLIFYEGCIYSVDEKSKSIFEPFYEELEKNGGNIRFSKNCADEVTSYVIAMLNKINVKLSVNKELKKKIVNVPLKVEVFLDKLNDCIIANIKFKYNELSINPLRKNKNEASKKEEIFIRDVNKELNITRLFENYGFQTYGESYINNSEDEIVDFFIHGLEKLQNTATIFYSNSLKNFKVYSPNSYRGGIKINDQNFLELSFDIEGVDRSELKDVFEALKLKKKYYRLKKGGIVSLDNEAINDIAGLMEYLDVNYSELSRDNIKISKYNAFYIDNALEKSNLNFFQRSEEFKKIVNSIKEIKKTSNKLPKEFLKVLRKYQKVGFNWFQTLSVSGFGGILADEMGLGKTIQTIAFITSEIEAGLPVIVISPTSLVYNWKDEIEKFSPKLKTLVVIGNKTERRELLKNVLEYNVVLTSYPLIRNDIEDYEKIQFKYCFLDEAQQIKNPNSINAKSVKRIKAKNYFALTGTPMENSLTELWSIFDFIMPGYLLNHSKFIKKYEIPIIKDKDQKVLKELSKHIQPFILRRLKKDVIKELPPKIEHKVVVEMTEEQKKVYASYLLNTKREIEHEINEKGFNKSKLSILSLLTRLRQICCNPSSFIENFDGESGKILALQDILEESIRSKHRILIFSQFTTVLKSIGRMLKKDKIDYMYLDGQTDIKDRADSVSNFNNGVGDVFLISLKAGGTGLNLTGADVVIHFDPWWNPAVEEQASDRAHRIGQKKSVEVIKLIARGTIEEKIYELQEKKKQIINDIINDKSSDKNILSKITEDELRDILA